MVGIIISLLSFAYGLFTVIKHLLYGDPVQGFTTLATVILFFAGVNLISVGVLGEYIGRIFGEVKGRPVYIVRKQAGRGLESVTESNKPTPVESPRETPRSGQE